MGGAIRMAPPVFGDGRSAPEGVRLISERLQRSPVGHVSPEAPNC